MAEKVLLATNPTSGTSARVQLPGEIRPDTSSGKEDRTPDVRPRVFQVPDPKVQTSEERDPTGLLFLMREDQISLHNKYTTLIRTVDSLAGKIEELQEKIKTLERSDS